MSVHAIEAGLFHHVPEAKEPPKQGFSNLILVPGHAPFKKELTQIPPDLNLISPTDKDRKGMDNLFVLQDFQRGEGPAYVRHIQEGLALAAENPSAMLVFSGACTREQGGWTEAESYNAIAKQMIDQLRQTENGEKYHAVSQQTRTDIGALDSFQNAEGGLAVYMSETGRRPEEIHVVGWDFKELRFRNHFAVLGEKELHYHGVTTPDNEAAALRGEAKTVIAFNQDPYGVGPDLREKREKRNLGRIDRTVYYGNMFQQLNQRENAELPV